MRGFSARVFVRFGGRARGQGHESRASKDCRTGQRCQYPLSSHVTTPRHELREAPEVNRMALDTLKTIRDGGLFGTGRPSYGDRKSCPATLAPC